MLKKDKHTLSLVIEIDYAKIANVLIDERSVFDQTVYRYIRYNLIYRIKQYFNCSEFGYILIHW